MRTALIIEHLKSQIIDTWLNKLKEKYPEVKNYSKSAIQDDVPELMDTLAKSLLEENIEELNKLGLEHGKQRTDFANYSIGQVIKEYHLLKTTIFDALDKHPKADVSNDERNHIINVIDKAIEKAAEKFSRIERQKIINKKEEAEQMLTKLKGEDLLRDNFISAISHDLNNPINNIKMAVELLKKKSDTPDQKDLINIIERSTGKAERLIKDLLDVNLINTGLDLPLTIGYCNLLSLIQETVEQFQWRYGVHRLQLMTDLTNINIKADCDKLIRAIENLIDNAFKYGDHQQPIVVKCRKNADILYISIINYGNPIPLKDQAHIFSRYYRAGKLKQKGWGIGLSLVKGITEAHGGKVSVDSSSENGTAFTIAIPDLPEE